MHLTDNVGKGKEICYRVGFSTLKVRSLECRQQTAVRVNHLQMLTCASAVMSSSCSHYCIVISTPWNSSPEIRGLPSSILLALA